MLTFTHRAALESWRYHRESVLSSTEDSGPARSEISCVQVHRFCECHVFLGVVEIFGRKVEFRWRMYQASAIPRGTIFKYELDDNWLKFEHSCTPVTCWREPNGSSKHRKWILYDIRTVHPSIIPLRCSMYRCLSAQVCSRLNLIGKQSNLHG